MKNLCILLFILTISFSSNAQSNVTAIKSFSLNEIISLLEKTSGKKQLDSIFSSHGYLFENKGSVYAPSVNGPVKNAYTLRYKQNTFRVIISYFNNTPYLVNYFAPGDEELDKLLLEIHEKGIQLITAPNSKTSSYGEYQKYRINIYNGNRKVVSIADVAITQANQLVPF
ncbi:hypothetical protein ACFQZI_08065 [Mucilaginibacter lutimaris]|uniref:Uncharacterized protein n=1 Tax=Mucilaginibacter lutimaris TaxID=931629 RepID=A0ABW2ZF71_9SPHI